MKANPVMKTESEYEYEEYYGTEYSDHEIQPVENPSPYREITTAQPKVKLEVSPKKIFIKAPSPEIKKMVLESKLKGKPEFAAPIVASKPSLIIDNGN